MTTTTERGYNAAVNVFCPVNEFIDYTFLVCLCRAEEAAAVLDAALAAWYDDDDPPTLGEAFQAALIAAGIPFLIDGEEV